MNEFRTYHDLLWSSLAAAALALAGCASGRGVAAPAAVADVPQTPSTTGTLERLPPVPTRAPSAAAPSEIRPVAFESQVTIAQPPQPPPDVPADDRLPVPRTPQPQSFREEVAAPQVPPVLGAPPALPLDLPTALGLAQGQNPRIAFAQAQIAQAYAQNRAARVMWLPSLRAGMNYNKHEGRIQDVIGTNIETSRGAMYGGLGANAVGAGSPAIPGLYMQFHTTDAIYQPRITGYALNARQQQGTAVANDQLLETALAYVDLLEALQREAIATQSLKHGEALVDLTANFAKTGAGNQADADRASAAAALLRNEAVRAEEAIAVASARLAQQLSADPSIPIAPQESTVVPIDLVPVEMFAGDLVATGLSNRPELAASRALVGEAVSRLQREQHAPWLPSVVLGLSYGAFGAGRGGDIARTGDRLDLDAIAWWELRNLGFGEAAARANASAQIQQARMREVETLDLVAREVVEAHAQVVARRKLIGVAEGGIQSAQQSYDRNLARIRNAQGLPIEVLQSIQALDAAQREYLRAVIDYNQAQFRLQRALGWPVTVPISPAGASPG